MQTSFYPEITAPRWGPEESEYQDVPPKKPWVYGTGKQNALIKIARETYVASGFEFPCVLFMDHPAARRWTSAGIVEMRDKVEAIANELKQKETQTACAN